MSTNRSALVNTLLGPDSSFRGDIVVDGFLRIDGTMRGTLRSNGKVVVSELARCDASIMAASAVIGGVVRGDVLVTERLSLQPGAIIVGNVFAPLLDAEGDITIHGHIEVSGKLVGAADAMHAFMKKHNSGLRPMGQDMPDYSGSHPMKTDN